VSYAGLGSPASYKRYWSNYAKMCQGMADEGACLNRAIQHGANVTFSASGLGQTARPPSALLWNWLVGDWLTSSVSAEDLAARNAALLLTALGTTAGVAAGYWLRGRRMKSNRRRR